MNGGDLLDANAYTINGMSDSITSGKNPTRNQRRESRFNMSSAPCPLPIYHSELDRNLVNHFQKPAVRATLQSKKFQRMLPGIDHELKMEMNPPLEYQSNFSRGMFKGKQGGNTSYAQGAAFNGVRRRLWKDDYHVADVDGKLQPKVLQQEKIREVLLDKSPRRFGNTTRALVTKASGKNIDKGGDTTDLSMVTNICFGIRNETQASPFLRRIKGGVAKPKQEEPPSRPDSVRSEDIISKWDTGASTGAAPIRSYSQAEFLDVSKKYPPHMQHHHHFGWGDAHICTSLYKPRNVEAKAVRDAIPDTQNAVKHIDRALTTWKSISRCPTSMNA